MSELSIAIPETQDLKNILLLYQSVAKVVGGLARTQNEITEEYVRHNLLTSRERGLSFIARIDKNIAGEIHCYRPFPKVFSHVLSDLTIAVHPHYQKQGVGRALFTRLLNDVKAHHPDILRIELIARESNQRAIQFYQTLGFMIEGRMVNRIRSVDGSFEADIPMAWIREKVEAFHPN
jgi:ribosomal protein S18 acetylase RimI-like enzyme